MGNYALAVRMYPELLRTLAYGSLSDTYIRLGDALMNPSVQTIIQNWTNQPIVISWDGINDHFPLAAGCAWDSDNVSNKTRESGLFIPQGQQFYIRTYDATPTSGAIFLTTFYGQGV